MVTVVQAPVRRTTLLLGLTRRVQHLQRLWQYKRRESIQPEDRSFRFHRAELQRLWELRCVDVLEERQYRVLAAPIER